ncbi:MULTISPECIES: hypothetical protein [Xanthomonas]|uniref:hypothetical protein n=1 Tax=Xanthomonas TaxID=338 RepID=UPI0012905BEE|nr:MULTISPECIES: hypothetical protein [Xanthomonas]
MECKQGSTELTLMRSLLWRLGLAGEVNYCLGIRTGERWLPPQKDTFAQGFNQYTDAVRASIVWMVFGMYWLMTSTRAVFALHAEKKFVYMI